LYNEEGRRRIFIHKLVYEAFIGPVPNGYCIDHIDGDKYNNNLNNLRILTYEQNSKLGNYNREHKNNHQILRRARRLHR
jgi:hypothetical protein